MGGCAAVNCSNHSRKKSRMFKFPKDPDRRRRWIINCGRDGWLPGNSSELCSGHFEESQFEAKRADNWRKLKPNAVPTLFNVPNPPAVFTFEQDKKEKYPNPKLVSGDHLVDDAVDTITERPDTLLERIAYLESENKTLKLELESNKRIISFLCDKKIIFSEKPSADPLHPDYTPSLFSFNENAVKIGQRLLKRYEKSLKRSRNEECLKNNSEGKPMTDPQHPDYNPSIVTSNKQGSHVRHNKIEECLEDEESINIIGKPHTDLQQPDYVPSVCTFKQPRSFLQYKRSMNCSIKEESIKNSYKETSCEASCSHDSVVPSMDIDDNSVSGNTGQKRDVTTITAITMQHISQMGEENMDFRKKIITLENTLQQLKLLNS